MTECGKKETSRTRGVAEPWELPKLEDDNDTEWECEEDRGLRCERGDSVENCIFCIGGTGSFGMTTPPRYGLLRTLYLGDMGEEDAAGE